MPLLPRLRIIAFPHITTPVPPYLLKGPVPRGIVGTTLHKEVVRWPPLPFSPVLGRPVPLSIRNLGVETQTGLNILPLLPLPEAILRVRQKTLEPLFPETPYLSLSLKPPNPRVKTKLLFLLARFLLALAL